MLTAHSSNRADKSYEDRARLLFLPFCPPRPPSTSSDGRYDHDYLEMALSIFEVRKELLFTVCLIVVGGKQCVREMRPLSLPFCLLSQPASEAHELLEKRMNCALVKRRCLKPAVSKERGIRGKSSYKSSNSLRDMSRFCSPEKQERQW